MKRRQFIKHSVAAGALAGFPTIIPAAVLGKNGQVPPSERINIGMIGCGGITHTAEGRYMAHPQAHMLAVCDPYQDRRLAKKKIIDAHYAKAQNKPDYNGCLEYRDFRDLLANKDIDGVYIATGDYWHVPISIMAARAGKDLHTEKPLGLCIHECLQMEKAARKFNTVFQYGTEGRSMIGTRLGVELVLNGHIGKVRKVVIWAPAGQSGGNFTPAPIPDGFDYDLWLGPAPEAEYSPGRCANTGIYHYYDYAIGFIAGWGAHPMDIFQWWADHSGLDMPGKASGTGTIPTEGAFNTITHWDVSYEYGSGLDVRFMDDATAGKTIPGIDEIKIDVSRKDHGVVFIGEKGQVFVQRGLFMSDPLEIREKHGRNPGPVTLHASRCHEHDWVDSMISRKLPVSDLASAVRSDILCHLGDISIRTGRKIKWDLDQRTIVDDEAARAMMYRTYRKPWSVEV
ncbi:MAG: Gfo/Idh/MocA family protein [Luteolibacter sp.]